MFGTTTTVIDGHTHIASAKMIPMSFIESTVENAYELFTRRGIRTSRTRILDMFLEKMQDHDCVDMLAEMEECGIEKSVLLLPDFTYALKDSALSIEEMFDYHRDIYEKHPDKFYVFAGVDPRWGKDGVDLFERGVRDYGFHGLKLYPPCGYSPSDPMLYPYYEICAEYGLPVLTHTGPTSPVLTFETACPIHVDRAARDFSTVNFILAHGSTWYKDDCVMLCTFRPNVYLDISAFESKPLSDLSYVFSKNINHKIIFGTDWPLYRMQGKQKAFMELLKSEESPVSTLSPRESDLFYGGIINSLIKHNNPSLENSMHKDIQIKNS